MTFRDTVRLHWVLQDGLDVAKAKVPKWPFDAVEYVPLTTADLLKNTAPLLKTGLTGAYIHRIWDFGKIWALDRLPQTTETAIMTDVDFVFRPGMVEVFKWHQDMRTKNSDWIMAGVGEPKNYVAKPPNPWEMKNLTSPVCVPPLCFRVCVCACVCLPEVCPLDCTHRVFRLIEP